MRPNNRPTLGKNMAMTAEGADDYITKPFSPKEVVYRIKAILKREQYHAEKNDNCRKCDCRKAAGLEIYENEGVVKKDGAIL
jgi:DNA-binding response OmpR family regulator